MYGKAWIGVTVAVGLIAAIIVVYGRSERVRGEELRLQRSDSVRLSRSADAAKETARLRSEVAALQKENRDLRTELEKARGPELKGGIQAKPSVAGSVGKEGSIVEGSESTESLERSRVQPSAADAADIADVLGLDPSRGVLLERAYEETTQQYRVIEVQMAQVATEGNKTVIRIPRYPEEGAAVWRSWRERVAALLSPQEMARYDRFALDENFWIHQRGETDRTITITAGKFTSVRESGNGRNGGSYTKEMTGGADVLNTYRYLLQN